MGEATGRVSIRFDCRWNVPVAEREDDRSITEGRRETRSGGVRASVIDVTQGLSTNELLATVGKGKCWIGSMKAGGVTRPWACGGGGLSSGEAPGASRRIDAPQGWGYGKSAHVRHTCVYRGVRYPGGKPGTPAQPPFQLL